MTRLLSYLFVCVLLCFSTARGQELKVSLLTIGPGEEVYELFGHNAIVFENSGFGDGSPIAFNWGVFDFNQPNFIGRFIMGRMQYSIGAAYEREMVEDYRAQKRMVVRTELKLSQAEARRLLDLCLENNEKGNREYRYDYYRDNCSTRVRDILDKGTEGKVAAALKGKPAMGNFRWHTDRLCRQTPWLYVALHYVLGHPVDGEINAWGEAFLPGRLYEHLKTTDLLGAEMVLVPDTSGRGLSGPAERPEWKIWFLLAGLLWGGALVGLSRLKSKWGWKLAMLLAFAWAGLCVVGGGISTWAWLFTDHDASRWNENWLQLSPVSVAILIPCGLAIIGRPANPWKWVLKAAYLVLGMSVAGVVIKVLPMMGQPNWEIILLALPIHLAMAVALRSREKRSM